MIATDERLQTNYRSVRDIDLRLIVKNKLFALDGVSQFQVVDFHCRVLFGRCRGLISSIMSQESLQLSRSKRLEKMAGDGEAVIDCQLFSGLDLPRAAAAHEHNPGLALLLTKEPGGIL